MFDQEGERKKTSCFGLITVPRVRLVMFCIEMILTTGAGMTVKFFPVFFKERTLGFSASVPRPGDGCGSPL